MPNEPEGKPLWQVQAIPQVGDKVQLALLTSDNDRHPLAVEAKIHRVLEVLTLSTQRPLSGITDQKVLFRTEIKVPAFDEDGEPTWTSRVVYLKAMYSSWKITSKESEIQ